MTQYHLVLLVAIITNTLYGQANYDLRALSASDDYQVAAKAYKDLALEQCTDSLSLHVAYAKQGIALARSIGNDTLVRNIPYETVQEAKEKKAHGQTWHIDVGNYPVTDKVIIDKRLGEIQSENQVKVEVGN